MTTTTTIDDAYAATLAAIRHAAREYELAAEYADEPERTQMMEDHGGDRDRLIAAAKALGASQEDVHHECRMAVRSVHGD